MGILLNIAAHHTTTTTTHTTLITGGTGGGGGGGGWLQVPTTNLEEINIFQLGPLVTQDIFRMNWKKKPEQKQELIPLSCLSKNSHSEGCPAYLHIFCVRQLIIQSQYLVTRKSPLFSM